MSEALNQWWQQRNARERGLLGVMLALLALCLLWLLLIRSPWQAYRDSAAAHAKLDREWAQVQVMAQQARQLQALPPANVKQALRWIEESSKKLGEATVTTQGPRVQVQFTGATAQVLAQWLSDARTVAQLPVQQASWRRSATQTLPVARSAAGAGADVLWDGSVVFELPQ